MYQKRIIHVVLYGLVITIVAGVWLLILELNKQRKDYVVDEAYVSERIVYNANNHVTNELLVDNDSSIREQLVDKPLKHLIKEDKPKEEIANKINKTVPMDVGEDVEKTDTNKHIEIKVQSTDTEHQETIGIKHETLGRNHETLDIKHETLDEKSVKKYTGEDWIDEKIDAHINEVDEDDLAVALSIAQKVDENKVMRYMEDGLTEEKKEEVKAYLKSELTSSEYEILKELIEEYAYLLDENSVE